MMYPLHLEQPLKPCILAIHGGAGHIALPKEGDNPTHEPVMFMKEMLHKAFALWKSGWSAVDLCTHLVSQMEDHPAFNAGRGSVLTQEGNVEMDASIMNGINLKSGAVCGLKNHRNPIQVAQAVMEKSPHILLQGEGAAHFAKDHGFKMESDDYFKTPLRLEQWQRVRDGNKIELDHSPFDTHHKHGTVGAVVKDLKTCLAAATSTGGMSGKKWGRVGDSPIVGAGVYANQRGAAISCTGYGEYFLTHQVAFRISETCREGYPMGGSLVSALSHIMFAGADGGAIAINALGSLALGFNTLGMYRGWIYENGEVEAYAARRYESRAQQGMM